MRRLAALLVAGLALAACDATDDRPDAVRLVDPEARAATSLNTRVLGLTVPVLDLSETESTLRLTAGGAFDLQLRFPDGGLVVGPEGATVTVPLPAAVSVSGTYTIDDAADTITVVRGGGAGTLTLGYAFRGTRGLELIAADDGTLAALVGVAAGPDAETLARLVDGGSLRFDP